MSKIILKTKIKNNSIITENNSLIFNDIITESKIISNYDDIIKKHNDYIRAIFIKNVEKDMNIKKNMNNKNEKINEKYNVPFCSRHARMVAESEDQKTLKHGFFFESDRY